MSAHSFNPDVMEIIAVATDGQARSNEWNGNWSGWQIRPAATFPPGAFMCPGVFAVATDGYVRGNGLLLNETWHRVS